MQEQHGSSSGRIGIGSMTAAVLVVLFAVVVVPAGSRGGISGFWRLTSEKTVWGDK